MLTCCLFNKYQIYYPAFEKCVHYNLFTSPTAPLSTIPVFGVLFSILLNSQSVSVYYGLFNEFWLDTLASIQPNHICSFINFYVFIMSFFGIFSVPCHDLQYNLYERKTRISVEFARRKPWARIQIRELRCTKDFVRRIFIIIIVPKCSHYIKGIHIDLSFSSNWRNWSLCMHT